MADARAVHLLELTVIKLDKPIHSLHIVGIYRSKSKSKVEISKLIDALKYSHDVSDHCNTFFYYAWRFQYQFYAKFLSEKDSF